MRSDSAKVAAKWWADQLRNGSKMDNGAYDFANVMSMAMLSMENAKERRERDPSKIDLFEDALARRFEAIDDARWPFPISIAAVDYDPDRHLVEAAEEAGLSLGMASLPVKTSMYSCNGKISVSCGYRAPLEELCS